MEDASLHFHVICSVGTDLTGSNFDRLCEYFWPYHSLMMSWPVRCNRIAALSQLRSSVSQDRDRRLRAY
jgi:hypothetical protein